MAPVLRGTLRVAAAGLLILAGGGVAQADVRVLFQESAPKDIFEIRNTGGSALGPMTLTLDLTGSSGGLIFDTAAQGPGVQVYQPFELVLGAERVRELPEVRDGGRSIELAVIGLQPREALAFTIDVDDTLAQSPLGQTRVAGSEIRGAQVTIAFGGGGSALPKTVGQFSGDAVAVLPVSNCVS